MQRKILYSIDYNKVASNLTSPGPGAFGNETQPSGWTGFSNLAPPQGPFSVQFDGLDAADDKVGAFNLVDMGILIDPANRKMFSLRSGIQGGRASCGRWRFPGKTFASSPLPEEL